MYPWLWFWAPQIYFPWSGSVSQNIEPRTDWFVAHIPAEAGNAQLEAKITEHASYGKQLGLITEALLGLADQLELADPSAQQALDRLKALQSLIEQIKTQEYHETAERLVRQIQTIQGRGGQAYAGLVKALLPVLGAQVGGSSSSD